MKCIFLVINLISLIVYLMLGDKEKCKIVQKCFCYFPASVSKMATSRKMEYFFTKKRYLCFINN